MNNTVESNLLHDPGTEPAVVLVLQDLRKIQVVQGHVNLDSCRGFSTSIRMMLIQTSFILTGYHCTYHDLPRFTSSFIRLL
jgi:hypothetical protein